MIRVSGGPLCPHPCPIPGPTPANYGGLRAVHLCCGKNVSFSMWFYVLQRTGKQNQNAYISIIISHQSHESSGPSSRSKSEVPGPEFNDPSWRSQASSPKVLGPELNDPSSGYQTPSPKSTRPESRVHGAKFYVPSTRSPALGPGFQVPSSTTRIHRTRISSPWHPRDT